MKIEVSKMRLMDGPCISLEYCDCMHHGIWLIGANGAQRERPNSLNSLNMFSQWAHSLEKPVWLWESVDGQSFFPGEFSLTLLSWIFSEEKLDHQVKFPQVLVELRTQLGKEKSPIFP